MTRDREESLTNFLLSLSSECPKEKIGNRKLFMIAAEQCNEGSCKTFWFKGIEGKNLFCFTKTFLKTKKCWKI